MKRRKSFVLCVDLGNVGVEYCDMRQVMALLVCWNAPEKAAVRR